MRKKKPDYKDVKIAGVIVLAIFVIVFWINHAVWGAVVNQPYMIPSVDGQYDSARVDTYVLNGTSFAFVDSQTVLSLPNDTTFGLNDTSNWVVYITYFYGTDSITDPLFYNLNPSATATATVDYDSIASLISNGFAGGGIYKVLVYTIDTSGTDDTVSSTVIDINTSTGSDYAGGNRNSSGLDSFNLDAATYQGLVYKTGYQFDAYDFTVTTNDTISILGYNTVTLVSSPVDTGFCRVYGYVKDRGNGVYGANIQLVLPDHAYDSCNNTILITKVFEDNTDGDGFFSMDVPKSSCLNRNTDGSLMKYSVEFKYKSSRTKKHEFSIPADSTTYYLVF